MLKQNSLVLFIILFIKASILMADGNNIDKWIAEEKNQFSHELLIKHHEKENIERWKKEIEPIHAEFTALLDILESNKSTDNFAKLGLSGLPDNYSERYESLRKKIDNIPKENIFLAIASDSHYDLRFLALFYIKHGGIDITTGELPEVDIIKYNIVRIFGFKQLGDQWKNNKIDAINSGLEDSSIGINQIFGLSLEEIKNNHQETGYGDTGRIFDNKYEVTIWDGYAKRIKLNPLNYNSKNIKKGLREAETLIPKDSEFIKEAQHPFWNEITMRLYKSNELIEKRKDTNFNKDTKELFSIQYIKDYSLVKNPHDDFFVITYED